MRGPTKTERGVRSSSAVVRQRVRVIITIIAACTIMDLGGAEARETTAEAMGLLLAEKLMFAGGWKAKVF